MRALIIKMPSLREELCYSSASLVDEASKARRHNKRVTRQISVSGRIHTGRRGPRRENAEAGPALLPYAELGEDLIQNILSHGLSRNLS